MDGVELSADEIREIVARELKEGGIVISDKKRGHEIVYDLGLEKWFYLDDNTIADYDRPCVKCGELPTENGHDACIANLSNVQHACCGHGVERGYIKLLDGTAVEFDVNREDEIINYCKNIIGGDVV